jgi:hypothetical protein
VGDSGGVAFLAGEADLVDFLAGALLAEVFLAGEAFFAGVVFLAGAADLLGFGGVDFLAVAFFAGVGAFFAGDLLAGVALFAAGFSAAGREPAGAAGAAPLLAAGERAGDAGEVAGPVVPERVGWGWGCASRSMRTRAWMIPAAAMISPIRNHRRFTARTLIPLPRRPTDTTV